MNVDNRYLGTREAADLLDVGESTVKRWADRGILPVELTAGKHRKIRLADLARVATRLNLPRARLERLAMLPPIDIEDQFHHALLSGDGPRASALLRAA
ncbi:MAG: helix-turn-helix domain-containing protein, partial [Gemmataceae bacterium]